MDGWFSAGYPHRNPHSHPHSDPDPDPRSQELIATVTIFTVEMSQIYNLARTSAVYRFIYYNIGIFKFAMYACVVLLNINVAMVGYGKDHPGGPGQV